MIAGSFQAMGGTLELQLANRSERDADRIASLFEQYEQKLSRFLPWSELSVLNRSGGAPLRTSEILFEAIEDALAWARRTNGVFDPTMLDVLETSGYDRSFEQIRGSTVVRTHPYAANSATWRAIHLNRATRTISMPAGTRIDLGGIGKGYTVDCAIAALGAHANAMVNASGDLYAAGEGPEGEGWIIGVEDPVAPDRDIATLRVRDRGVATSGSTGRHWSDGSNQYHHLIDSRTRRCSESDLLTVTVVSVNATDADVLAKAAFLLGSVEGLSTVERFGAAAIGVTRDGGVLRTRTLEAYLL